MEKSGFYRVFLLLLLVLLAESGFGQRTHSLLWESDVKLELPTKTRWAFSVGAANRTLISQQLDGKKITYYQNKYFEVNQFSRYAFTSGSALALGLRYRFQEIFDEYAEDEFSLIEQYSLSSALHSLKLKHRLQIEERLKSSSTSYRFRYRLRLPVPLSKEFGLVFGTEALYSISSKFDPHADQRVGAWVGNSSFDNLHLLVGFQYRLENYLDNAQNNYFFLSSVAYSL